MSLTRIIQPIFASRRRALDKYQTQAEQLQMQVLHRLVNKAKDTEAKDRAIEALKYIASQNLVQQSMSM